MLKFLSILLLLGATAVAQSKDAPFPAHKVAGNLFYVGSQSYASYLITTPEGHILINSSFEETVPLIRTSVESLGFKFTDIKILLNSHAHNDHVAGNARVQKLTGAQAYIMKGDEGIVTSGGLGDFQYQSRWSPSKVDKVLSDGEKVTLGGVTLVAHHTPGHTRGCTTWAMVVEDGGRKLNAVIVGSPNVNPGYKLVNNATYPEIAEDYRKMFRVLKALPCDLFLGAHGSYYNLAEKYAQRQKQPDRNPFIDPQGYRRFVESKEKQFLLELASQQRAGGSQ